MDAADSLSVDEARARILAEISPIPPVVRPLTASRGLVLAAPVVSPLPLPPFRGAAMDGFAVRAADTEHAREQAPASLRVINRVDAGDSPDAQIAPGEAVRIMTGAPVPAGADAVVRLEDIDEESRADVGRAAVLISVSQRVEPGQNIREAGEEIAAGQPVLAAGEILDPARLGLLAALGIDQVEVHRRPRVGILSTGDELAPPGRSLRPGQVYDANGAMIEALVSEAGADPIALGIAADHAPTIITHLAVAGSVDLLVTSGGVSVGDRDLLREALGQHGSASSWQVRMKPGKPLAFGRIGGVPLIGLPGTPVAAAISFLVFVQPVLAKLARRRVTEPPLVLARLTQAIDNRGGRRQYARATVTRDAEGVLVATPLADQSSAKLSVLSHANALVVVPESVAIANAGAQVPVMLLERDADQIVRLLLPAASAAPAPG